MIKTKAFSTFIVCSILISGISNSYILGMDEEGKNDEEKALLINGNQTASKKSWSSAFTWRNARKAFVAFLALSATAVDGYEYDKDSTSPVTPNIVRNNRPLIPSIKPKPLLVCPLGIPLNGKHRCPTAGENDLPYWSGAHLGEAIHSEEWIPECTPQPDKQEDSFKAPKTFVVDANSPHLDSLLDRMLEANVTYYFSGFAEGLGGPTLFFYYTYESKNESGFVVPTRNFTVSEIEKDKKAMEVIADFFRFSNTLNPTPCHKFILGEGEE